MGSRALGSHGYRRFPVVANLFVFGLVGILISHARSAFRLLLCATIALAFIFFSAFTATSEHKLVLPFPQGNYERLAESLFHGKLYLPTPVDPKILALPDPYDSMSRGDAPFEWDCSLYGGKYYLYFGIAPVLTWVGPFYLLTHQYPTELLSCLWFAIWSWLAGCLLTLSLLERFQKSAPTAMQKVFTLFVFLCAIPYGGMLRRTNIYELAIFAGSAYALTALFLFHRSCMQKSFTRKSEFGFIFSGLALGLAFASRPTTVLLAPIFLIIFLQANLLEKRKSFFRFVWGALPIFTFVLVYNFLRFENPFDFGFHYQMNNLVMRDWGFDLKDSLFASAGYLFQWPKWTKNFPFTDLERFGEGWLVYRHRYMNDQMIGWICAAPFSIFLFLDRKKILQSLEKWILFVMLFSGLFVMGIDTIAGLCTRYEFEFLPFLVIPGLVWGLFQLEHGRSFLKRTFLFGLFLYSIQLGLFSSTSIEMQFFRSAKPELVQKLNRWFSYRVSDFLFQNRAPPLRVFYSTDSLMHLNACVLWVPSKDQWIKDLGAPHRKQ